jgi:hypothetical protein
METLETVWSYCTSNNRAIPRDWNKLWQMLSNKKQKASGGWEPPLPLILAAWYETSPLEKHLRFREHIQWAEKNNQLEEIGKYLKSLKEEDWYHFGELPS